MLEGKVAIVTGAGRGIGREHALLLARCGARVVVNDVGGSPEGIGGERRPADDVVGEIEAAGGEAVANFDDISSWEGGEAIVQQALDTFGDLDVLVNNAGILRDRTIVKMPEEDWDTVVRVHLRGHFVPLHFAARYWRDQTKAGADRHRAVVNTSSESTLLANPGQANYAAAKAGIASLTTVAAKELARYGVRVNGILPRARTRLTEEFLEHEVPEPGAFDRLAPANVAPFVAHLASDRCPWTGELFVVGGGTIQRVVPWHLDADHQVVRTDRPWTVDDVAEVARSLVPDEG